MSDFEPEDDIDDGDVLDEVDAAGPMLDAGTSDASEERDPEGLVHPSDTRSKMLQPWQMRLNVHGHPMPKDEPDSLKVRSSSLRCTKGLLRRRATTSPRYRKHAAISPQENLSCTAES